MKELIRKILREQNTGTNPLSRTEIMLFKYINSKKKEAKTKPKLMELITTTLKSMGLEPSLAAFYYEMFALNYREDGDYENLTHENFKGVKEFRSRTIPNTKAWEFTIAKMPFKGSNMDARWNTDSNGVDYYAVYSYSWYPIYLFKQGVWYEVTRRYSSSTGRQMSNANPVKYDSNIGKEVVLVTQDEMKQLERSATIDDIMKNKVKSAVKNKEQLISKKPKNVGSVSYWGDNEDANAMGFKVKFKVSDVREDDGKIVVDVNVMEVNRKEGNKAIKTPENYTKGELPGVTKERVEKNIIRVIQSDFTNYVGKSQPWGKNVEDRSNVKFNFIHEKE
jgi:ABC-type dipeptide/oligopeptide/nickel transport system ATPase component